MKLYTFDQKTLKYEHFKLRERLVRFTFLFILVFSILGISQPKIQTKYITNTEKITLVENLDIFNEELLIKEISKLNFKYPHIVLAQAILETGTFESKIFKENNNLFGMKEPELELI